MTAIPKHLEANIFPYKMRRCFALIGITFVTLQLAANFANAEDTNELESLTSGLKSPHLTDRIAAINAISKFGLAALDPLIWCLSLGDTNSDSNSYIRETAARTLANLGDARAVEPLVNYFKKWPHEPAAAVALKKFGDVAVVPLIACLKDSNVETRRAATDIFFWELKDSRAVEPLIERLKDEDLDVREHAARALMKQNDKRAIESLAPFLKNTNSNMRQMRYVAADSMGNLGYSPTNAFEKAVFLVALGNCEKAGKLGQAAVEPLLACFGKDKYTSADLRGEAAKALGNIGDKTVIPILCADLPDWEANERIGNALEKLGWHPEKEQDQVYFSICKQDKQWLNEHWDQTRKILFDDLRSNDDYKIINAVFTFVSLGETKVIVDLAQFLESSGNKKIAETYLNCGQKDLHDAAVVWAKQNGYSIQSTSGSGNVYWGHW